ncbi:MAG: outer membrane lipoprotein-sorting protein [Panacagrimonas sp.]
MKRKAVPCLFALALVALNGTAAMEVTTEMPLVQRLKCMKANAPQRISVSDLRLEVEGPDVATRHLTGRLFSQRDEHGLKVMLHIVAPTDLAGVRYLLIEDQPDDALYLYLPSLGKVRRLSGAGAESELAGTTLSYQDLRVMIQAVRGASISLSGQGEIAGRKTDILRFVPAVADSPFRRVIGSMDRESCLLLRAEFQDSAGTVKTWDIDPASLQRSGTRWYATSARMEDLKRRTRARLSLGGVRIDIKAPARLFDPRSFYKGD